MIGPAGGGYGGGGGGGGGGVTKKQYIYVSLSFPWHYLLVLLLKAVCYSLLK